MWRAWPGAEEALVDRDRSAMPIFMSSRTRVRRGFVMHAAAIAAVVAALVLRLV